MMEIVRSHAHKISNQCTTIRMPMGFCALTTM